MAREPRTIEQLEFAAEYLEQSGAKVRDTIAAMKRVAMPSLLMHGNAVLNTHLPIMWDWACRLPHEVESQSRDFVAKRASVAAKTKARAERQTKKKAGEK